MQQCARMEEDGGAGIRNFLRARRPRSEQTRDSKKWLMVSVCRHFDSTEQSLERGVGGLGGVDRVQQ